MGGWTQKIDPVAQSTRANQTHQEAELERAGLSQVRVERKGNEMAAKQMVLWDDEEPDDLIARMIELVDDMNAVLDELDRFFGWDGEQ